MAFSREVLVMASYQDREGGALQRMCDFAAPLAQAAALTLVPLTPELENRLIAGRGKRAFELGLRDELGQHYDALLCCESAAGAIGRGLHSFVETFMRAGKPVLVRRGAGLDVVVEARRVPEADWRASWAELKTRADVEAETAGLPY